MSYPRLFEQVDMGGMELAERGVMAASCSGFIEDALRVAYGETGVDGLGVLRAKHGGLSKPCCGAGDGC